MADRRMVGQGIRRRMGEPSSTLDLINSAAWRAEDARLLEQESKDPTFSGKRDNLHRYGDTD